MAQVMCFGDVLDAADQLTVEEQEELMAILRRRLTERARKELIAGVREAEEEFARGKCRPATVDEIMRRIRS